MITYKEAKEEQKKALKKCVVILIVALGIFSAVCIALYFVGKTEFYTGLYLSLFVFLFVAYKAKITELFRVGECEGEVVYFNVRNENIKKANTHQVGSKYDTYSVLFADITIKDKNGKTRHKTFRYTKDYDNVKAGDRAKFLRFVDKPVIEFRK